MGWYFDILIKVEVVMPFTKSIQMKIAVRAGYKCEVCGANLKRSWWKDWLNRRGSLYHAHSATSLHLVRSKSDPDYCMATSTPRSHQRLRNQLIPVRSFKVFDLGRDDDGFCLCHKCHRKIHNSALDITRAILPESESGNAIPSVLEEITLIYVEKIHR